MAAEPCRTSAGQASPLLRAKGTKKMISCQKNTFLIPEIMRKTCLIKKKTLTLTSGCISCNSCVLAGSIPPPRSSACCLNISQNITCQPNNHIFSAHRARFVKNTASGSIFSLKSTLLKLVFTSLSILIPLCTFRIC